MNFRLLLAVVAAAGLQTARAGGDQHDDACAARLQSVTAALRDVCCTAAVACSSGVPAGCSAGCAGAWLPYQRDCGAWVGATFPDGGFGAFTAQCEAAASGAAHRLAPGE